MVEGGETITNYCKEKAEVIEETLVKVHSSENLRSAKCKRYNDKVQNKVM